MRHGTNACYQLGCRRTECVRAHKVAQARWLHDVAKDGPRLVDSKLVLSAVDYCRQAGITWSSICATAGCPGRSLADMTDTVHVDTRRRLIEAMRKLLEERQSQVEDAWSALDLAAGWEPDAGTWPTAAMVAVIDRKYGPPAEREREGITVPLSGSDRRQLYRSEVLDTERAERMCRAIGVYPESVWPDWFEAEAKGGINGGQNDGS